MSDKDWNVFLKINHNIKKSFRMIVGFQTDDFNSVAQSC